LTKLLQTAENRFYNRRTATERAPAPPQLEPSESIRPEELRLATRNHGLPLEALWNLGGYANNEVQRVHVTVGSA
jgi:hypothetical protein